PRKHNIRLCRVLKRSRGQLTTLRQIESALSDSLSDVAVIRWVYNNRHRWVGLGSSTDHGWTADINLLDATIEVCARSYSLFKWVQVNHDQLEWLNLPLVELSQVIELAEISQQGRRRAWMQGLNPAFDALCKYGDRGKRSDVDNNISNLGRDGAGAPNLYSCSV